MVFFFALVTAEIVDAASPGSALYTWRRMALPFVAAVGGMIGATLAYFAWSGTTRGVRSSTKASPNLETGARRAGLPGVL